MRGLKERWGKDVLHCPYCHGWEVRDKVIGVLLSDLTHVGRQTLLFNQLSKGNVKLFLHTAGSQLAEKERERLVAMGVELIEGAVEELIINSETDSLKAVHVEGGRVVPIDALGVQTKLRANIAFASPLGLSMVTSPVGEWVKTITPTGRTELKGIWAVGNVADAMGQVLTSAANGLLAGTDVNFDLVDEDAEAAVARAREAKK